MAVAGLILGIIAVLLSAVPIINNFALLLAVFAFIFGIVGVMKTKGKKRKGRGMSVTSVVLAVVAVVVVLASQAMYGAALNEVGKGLDKATGNQTEELLKTDVSVTIGAFSGTTGDYGLVTTALPVTITNKNADKKSYSVKIEALDSAGTRIADDTQYANDLGAGQSQEVKFFQYVQSDQVEALKAATFKVVTVSQT